MKAILTLSLVLGALVSGCQSTRCEQVCSAANKCGVKERPVDVDCPEFCQDMDKLDSRSSSAGFTSCKAEWDAHLACWDKNIKSICNPDFADCAETGTAWTDCMAKYCTMIAESQTLPDGGAGPNPVYDTSCADGAPALTSF